MIHNPKAYVRDFYFFKRSQYPQLSLIHVDPEEAYNAMQNNVFYLKLLEIGKTLKSLAMLMRPDQVRDAASSFDITCGWLRHIQSQNMSRL